MKIVDIKTKIIPSNPRSKNYPIGYPGGIASNSNGVTPDLSIYLLKEIWERNFEERTDEYGNEYLYIRKPLAIGGGATMYASNGVVVPSIFDGLPLDNTTIRKNPETGLIEVIGGSGTSFDENAMWSALSGSSDNQINKSHLTTALDGYATQNWVIENYATKSELSAVSNKLNDFLEGSDTDTIINKWKELEAFLSGMAETDNLAEILETKADKKYVDSTFVTLATKQTITGEKTFSSLLNTAAIKASGEITTPSLAASDYVTIAGIKLRKLEDGALMLEGNLALTGALTMYASNGQSFDTIYDGLPIDNDTIYWQEVDGSRVLKAREGSGSSFDKSAMWNALAGSTTEQINKSHLTTALTGYATESWVSEKNYAVKATTLAGYGITDGINAVSVTGTGNAVTAASISGHTLTLTKGSTFLLSSQYTAADVLAKLKTVDGAGSDLEADILALTEETGSMTGTNMPAHTGMQVFQYYQSGNGPTDYGNFLRIRGHGGGCGELFLGWALSDNTGNIWYKSKRDTGLWGSWREVAFTDMNVASATKLQTARTIWGQSFDGTKPVTGALTSVTDITGTGTFTGANLKATDSVYVNGIRLHKTSDGVITLEGNLAVTGGITTYAIDPVSASTVMDGVVVDGTTIKKENGKLVAVGGGEAGSVAWGNISGKPSVFATNIANITDLHSSWDAVLAAQKPAWLTAVSIATISDLHANWDALLKAAPSAYVTRWPTISELTGKQNLIVKLNGGTTEGTNQFTYNATGAKTINITPAGIGAYTKSESDSKYPTKTGSGASGTWGINISGTAINADKLDEKHLQSGSNYWDRIPLVNSDGVIELGRYLDFHHTSSDSGDYSTRLQTQGKYNNIVSLPTGSGQLALTSDNVASANKLYTTRTLWGQSFNGEKDISGSLSNVGNIVPSSDNTYTLGNSTRHFDGAFVRVLKNNISRDMYIAQNTANNLILQTSGVNRLIITHNGEFQVGNSFKISEGNQASSYAVQIRTDRSDPYISLNENGNVWYIQGYNGYLYLGNGSAKSIRIDSTGNLYSPEEIYTPKSVKGNAGFEAYASYSGSNSNSHKLDINNCAFRNIVLALVNHNTSRSILGWMDRVNSYGYQTRYVIGSERGNSTEWGKMYLAVGNNDDGTSIGCSIEIWGKGQATVNGNLLVTGGVTLYGSDIRYKSIMQQVNLSLMEIAKAPSFVYHWNKEGMKCDRLNLGGSAQYTQSVLPWAVEDNDNFLSMDYATVAYTFAVHTARHLLTYETRTDKKIKKLENRVKYLEKQLKKLGYEEVRTLDDQSV